MRSFGRAGIVGVLVAVGLVVAPAASASIEAGDDCVANEGEGAYTIVALKRVSPSPLPLFAPVDGVVTRWKVNTNAPFPGVVERLRVLRPTGNPNEFQTVGESAEETVTQGGSNSFGTRIPVRAGDHFGIFGTLIDVLFCSSTADPADEIGYFIGDADPGTTATYTAETHVRVPVVATIEADRDNDGYGDETQDGCPQSAESHTTCPTVSLDSFPIVLKRSILVLVSASREASVEVFGQVRVPRRGGASVSKTRKPGHPKSAGLIVGLTGGTQALKPGAIGRFNVKLPRSLKQRLKHIPRSQKLTGTITARTIDLTGKVVDHAVAVRIPGQAPRRR
jgi:hypothetical protein